MNQNAMNTYKRAQAVGLPYPNAHSTQDRITEETNKLHEIAMKIRMMAPVMEGMMKEIRDMTEEMDVIARKVEAYS